MNSMNPYGVLKGETTGPAFRVHPRGATWRGAAADQWRCVADV